MTLIQPRNIRAGDVILCIRTGLWKEVQHAWARVIPWPGTVPCKQILFTDGSSIPIPLDQDIMITTVIFTGSIAMPVLLAKARAIGLARQLRSHVLCDGRCFNGKKYVASPDGELQGI